MSAFTPNYFSSLLSLPNALSFDTALFAKFVNIQKFDYTHKVLVPLVYNSLLKIHILF
jgi:hypothetical protein